MTECTTKQRGSSTAIETEILLLCARSFLGTAESSQLTHLAESEVRWSLLLEAAERHNLLPLLHFNRKQLKRAIPDHILKALEVRFVEYSRASVQMLDVLHTLLASFAHEGVVAVPFKGPVLGERYYGDLLYRTFCDLDVWVPQSQVATAHRCLNELGFAPCPWRGYIDFSETFFGNELFSKLCSEYAYLNELNRVSVDLHWKVLPAQLLPISENELESSIKTARIWNRDMRMFSDELSLIIVAVHGCKHGWSQINFLLDIALIIQNGSIDWTVVLSMCDKFDALQPVLSGLYLCKELLHLSVPQQLLHKMPKLKTMAWCQEIATDLLSDPMQPNWSEIKKWFFFASNKSGLLRQAAYLIGACTEPSLDEYHRFPLSPKLYPLYFALRPFNLTIDHGFRIAWRLLSGGYDSRFNVRTV